MIEKKILIVEDEGVIAMDIEKRLGRMGYGVSASVASGEEAIKKSEETQPDLVLMDIKLKGDIDGIDAAEQIQLRFDIPIVYVTAYADDITFKRAKYTEPFGYLLKPFEDRELQTAVEMALYRHDIEKKLRESEEKYRLLAETAKEIIISCDINGIITYINNRGLEIGGYKYEELLNARISDMVPSSQAKIFNEYFVKRIETDKGVCLLETEFINSQGNRISVELSSSLLTVDGKVAGVLITARDITERKQAEEALRRAHDELERRVGERTEELVTANQRLMLEIEERKRVERALRNRESDLMVQSRHLEEVNAALKVLLKRREEDKAELEENFLANVKELVLPYVEKLKMSHLDSYQLTLVNILESNVGEIVSPFVTKLSSRFLNLTPAEIQVAGLIKDGKSTKEIAGLLRLSENTIICHRYHIRSKLGLKNTKANLRSYLRTLNN